MSAEIDRLAALLEAGTPGPWTPVIDRRSPNKGAAVVPSGRPGSVAEQLSNADAELIVAAVNALPRLLAVARAAEEYRQHETDRLARVTGQALDAALAALDAR